MKYGILDREKKWKKMNYRLIFRIAGAGRS